MVHSFTPEHIAACIDHTHLKADATREDIGRLCDEARQCGFFSVCVNPIFVSFAHHALATSRVKVCSVVGFPLGASRSEIKVAEASHAIDDGAAEIDMVLAIGALRGGEDDAVRSDILAVAEVCHRHNALLKVILETALLTDEEKLRACQHSVQAGADFVKTSTGFASSGATVEDIQLMAKAVAPHGLGVKASGGIRNLSDAMRMLQAGATRLGCSASVSIVAEARHVPS